MSVETLQQHRTVLVGAQKRHQIAPALREFRPEADFLRVVTPLDKIRRQGTQRRPLPAAWVNEDARHFYHAKALIHPVRKFARAGRSLYGQKQNP